LVQQVIAALEEAGHARLWSTSFASPFFDRQNRSIPRWFFADPPTPDHPHVSHG
jgi:hypothetical protein